MDSITRSVRATVCSIFNELKIKHKSTQHVISSICFARQPLLCIKYVGPIEVFYKKDQCSVKVRKHFPPSENIFLNGFKTSISLSKDGKYIAHWPKKGNAFIRLDIGREYLETSLIYEELSLDIADPKFDVQLRDYIDASIPKANRSIDKSRELIKTMGCRFVPDLDIPKEEIQQSWWKTIKLRWNRLLGKVPSDNDFYWKQAIQRHFRISDEETNDIYDTMRALQFSTDSSDTIESMTASIKNQATRIKV